MYTENYEYLGLFFDGNNKHANSIIGQVSTKLKTLAHLQKYYNYETSLLIYKTMILPLLEYANLTHTLTQQVRVLWTIYYLDNHEQFTI